VSFTNALDIFLIWLALMLTLDHTRAQDTVTIRKLMMLHHVFKKLPIVVPWPATNFLFSVSFIVILS